MDVYSIHFLLMSHVCNSFSQDLARWVIYKIKSQTEQNIHLLNSTHLFHSYKWHPLALFKHHFLKCIKHQIQYTLAHETYSDRTYMTKSLFFSLERLMLR